MTVNVIKPPRPPALTGDWEKDMPVVYDWLKDAWRVQNQLYERTGGTTDSVSTALTTANTAAATASASQAGATIPTEGGSITLTPANPLSQTSVDADSAQIAVAGHTRTGAASPLVGANVAALVARGFTYYVYYSDAGDAGGAQTYLASADLATVTGTAGYRIIGTIDVPQPHFNDRTTE